MNETKTHNIRLIVTGGGTGGHLFPGISVAQGVLNTYPGSEVLFICTDREVDKKALAGIGFRSMSINSKGIKGKKITDVVDALLRQPLALWEAAKIIRRFKPDLVFGVGGYVTGPVILAARLLGVKTCIHEQNSIPGLANKMLGRIANRIFVSLPGSEKYFPQKKIILSGNPVRKNIIEAAREPKPKSTGTNSTLLILGGSQGARRLNSLMLEAAESCLTDFQDTPFIIHQTGAHDEDQVREKYSKLGLKARVQPFFNDMADIYQKADLIISRAGATTLAEITVFSKPVILVPFPFAADNHQEINGAYLVEAGAGLMFRQADLTGEKLGMEIRRILADKKILMDMSEKSGRIAQPEATETIIKECMTLLKMKMADSTGKVLAF